MPKNFPSAIKIFQTSAQKVISCCRHRAAIIHVILFVHLFILSDWFPQHQCKLLTKNSIHLSFMYNLGCSNIRSRVRTYVHYCTGIENKLLNDVTNKPQNISLLGFHSLLLRALPWLWECWSDLPHFSSADSFQFPSSICSFLFKSKTMKTYLLFDKRCGVQFNMRK